MHALKNIRVARVSPGRLKAGLSSREFSSDDAAPDCRGVTVTIVGGGTSVAYAGLMLKQNPVVREIRMVDADDSLAGPVCDLRQIDTSTLVKHYKRASILEGLRHADILAVMDETDFQLGGLGPFSQFAWSSSYVRGVAECALTACPGALVAVFARPVTASLPLVCELFQRAAPAHWDPNRILGSAALESMRIGVMAAQSLGLEPASLSVPVTGGVDALTLVPLLSRARPFGDFSPEEHCLLVDRLRSADRELSESETRGPTLSSGLAAASFISLLANGLTGRGPAHTSAYVRSDALPGCRYLATELSLGPAGVRKNYGLPRLAPRELCLLEQAVPLINRIVDSATRFLDTGRIK